MPNGFERYICIFFTQEKNGVIDGLWHGIAITEDGEVIYTCAVQNEQHCRSLMFWSDRARQAYQKKSGWINGVTLVDTEHAMDTPVVQRTLENNAQRYMIQLPVPF